MTGAERGFLLLTSLLGDPEAKPLTVAQFRELTRRCRMMERPVAQRELDMQDLLRLGLDPQFSQRILFLLSRQEQLDWYLKKGSACQCIPVSRISRQYPHRLHKTLDMEAPACLWMKGDLNLLEMPAISLVGNRELRPENLKFAQLLGRQAAKEGYALVSGNARGADREAEESCLAAGGCVISVVADCLKDHTCRERVLYVSEEGFDLPFTAIRALSRNRIIHAFSDRTFVAQCSLGKGGTWSGTRNNLHHGWSDVYCYPDGSDAVKELCAMGACLLDTSCPEEWFTRKPDQLTML